MSDEHFIDLAYKSTFWKLGNLDEELREALTSVSGHEDCDSGMGFGNRDIQDSFKDEATARVAAAKVAEVFGKYRVIPEYVEVGSCEENDWQPEES